MLGRPAIPGEAVPRAKRAAAPEGSHQAPPRRISSSSSFTPSRSVLANQRSNSSSSTIRLCTPSPRRCPAGSRAVLSASMARLADLVVHAMQMDQAQVGVEVELVVGAAVETRPPAQGTVASAGLVVDVVEEPVPALVEHRQLRPVRRLLRRDMDRPRSRGSSPTPRRTVEVVGERPPTRVTARRSRRRRQRGRRRSAPAAVADAPRSSDHPGVVDGRRETGMRTKPPPPSTRRSSSWSST